MGNFCHVVTATLCGVGDHSGKSYALLCLNICTGPFLCLELSAPLNLTHSAPSLKPQWISRSQAKHHFSGITLVLVTFLMPTTLRRRSLFWRMLQCSQPAPKEKQHGRGVQGQKAAPIMADRKQRAKGPGQPSGTCLFQPGSICSQHF